jgi:trimeric autotransporter adhesin
LGSAVVSSSLTSVGTIGTGVWNGTAIATAYIADSAITSAKIADDAIVNADINASAAIADTKLGTISTAGKVSNSATTATNANTASAIVARDGLVILQLEQLRQL